MRRENLSSVRASNYYGSAEELEGIIASNLLGLDPPVAIKDTVMSTDVVVKIEHGKGLVLKIYQRVEDLTFEVCFIHLQSTDKNIELFDWCGELTQTVAIMNQRRRRLEINADISAKELVRLREQFDELVKAKEAHEKELLEKFRLLLNSKKMRIREQQRRLAGAGTGSEGLEVHRASGGEGKRKRATIKHEDSDSSEGFEIAEPKKIGEEASEVETEHGQEAMTPQESHSEVNDTDDSLRHLQPPVAQTKRGGSVKAEVDTRASLPQVPNDLSQEEMKEANIEESLSPEAEETDDEL